MFSSFLMGISGGAQGLVMDLYQTYKRIAQETTCGAEDRTRASGVQDNHLRFWYPSTDLQTFSR